MSHRWVHYSYWPDVIEHRVYFLGWVFVNSVKKRQRWIERRPMPWARFGLTQSEYWRKHF